MPVRRPAVLGAPLLIAALLLAGCAAAADEPAPTSAAPTEPAPAPTTAAPSTAEPSSPSPVPTASDPGDPTAGWQEVELGGGDVRWRMPDDWSMEPTLDGPDDFSGILVDGAGTPMLTYAAVWNGQYATDFTPCERPAGTEVISTEPLDGLASEGGSLVVVAVPADRGVLLHAGISELDAQAACEPGILAIYPEALPYAFVRLDLVDDAADIAPRFDSTASARAYLDSEEFTTIREVLRTAAIGDGR
ncbi:hypothetical protein LG314_12115 [Agrococcus terreus]|uniref:hypothetical protein n=1 Tax=Agrococcus terreus TaxID=574649 RepID=UPI0038517653